MEPVKDGIWRKQDSRNKTGHWVGAPVQELWLGTYTWSREKLVTEWDAGWASFEFSVLSSRYYTLGHGAGPSKHAQRGTGQVPVQANLCLWHPGVPAPHPSKCHCPVWDWADWLSWFCWVRQVLCTLSCKFNTSDFPVLSKGGGIGLCLGVSVRLPVPGSTMSPTQWYLLKYVQGKTYTVRYRLVLY